MTAASVQQPVGIVHVFEKLPYWGPELKRQLAGRSILVREVRSVHDLQFSDQAGTSAAAVIVLDAGPADCLGWMARRFREESHCPFVIVASPALADLEWLIREAGAAGFVGDEISGSRLARFCLRLLGENAAARRRVAGPQWR